MRESAADGYEKLIFVYGHIKGRRRRSRYLALKERVCLKEEFGGEMPTLFVLAGNDVANIHSRRQASTAHVLFFQVLF